MDRLHELDCHHSGPTPGPVHPSLDQNAPLRVDKGSTTRAREIPVQILPDGAHVECSPSCDAPVMADLMECAGVNPRARAMRAFELSIGGTRHLVDGASSTYDAGLVRAYERPKVNHDCVEMVGEPTADCWASFRVGRRYHLGLRVSKEGLRAISTWSDTCCTMEARCP